MLHLSSPKPPESDKHTGESMCMLKFLGGFLSYVFLEGKCPQKPKWAFSLRSCCCANAASLSLVQGLQNASWNIPCFLDWDGVGYMGLGSPKKKNNLQFQWQLSLSASALLNLWYKCEATCAGSPVMYYDEESRMENFESQCARTCSSCCSRCCAFCKAKRSC